jgi:ArsR family transcriptional regulator
MKNNACCDNNSPKFKKIEDSTRLLKAITDANRIKILCILSKEKICVCDLAKRLDLAQNLVSHHLKVMQEVGLLEKQREGSQIYYFIIDSQKKRIIDLKRLIGIN